MSEIVSVLHKRFLDFAKGMPAIGISWHQISRDLCLFEKTLFDPSTGKPTTVMSNISMPYFRLAYTVELERLGLSANGTIDTADFTTSLLISIHPRDLPTEVICTYRLAIEPSDPAKLNLNFDEPVNQVYWKIDPISAPAISATAGGYEPDADTYLEHANVPEEPENGLTRRDVYERDAEPDILNLSARALATTSATMLPRYYLSDIMPWARFSLDPKFHPKLLIDLSGDHILISGGMGTYTTEGCNPQTFPLVPDPDFPHKDSLPPSGSTADVFRHLDLAVYIPKGLLKKLCARELGNKAEIKNSGGGLISWNMIGHLWTSNPELEVISGASPSGIASLRVDVLVDILAKAWINNPPKLTILPEITRQERVRGSGKSWGDGYVTVDLNKRAMDFNILVNRTSVITRWTSPLPWPLSEIDRQVLELIGDDEVKYLTRQAMNFKPWAILAIPRSYVESLRPDDPDPVARKCIKQNFETRPTIEGLKDVSIVAGVWRIQIRPEET